MALLGKPGTGWRRIHEYDQCANGSSRTISARACHQFGATVHWSVRRELWEHRSLYLAPAIVALVLLLAMMVAYSNCHR